MLCTQKLLKIEKLRWRWKKTSVENSHKHISNFVNSFLNVALVQWLKEEFCGIEKKMRNKFDKEEK